MKQWMEHFCFWRVFADEAKFSVKAFIPLFIAVLLPIAYPFFISLTYVNQTVVERSAVVLDLDNSEMSRDMILSLDATQGVDIIRRVDDLEEGIQAVMSRESDAFIFIPDDYSAKIKHFEQGNLKVYLYATNMMLYAAVMTGIQETVIDKNVSIAVSQIANPKGLTGEHARRVIDPIAYHRHTLYSPTLAYATFITPLMFTLVFHQMGLLLLGFSVGFHREIDPVFRRKKMWFVDYLWRYLYYVPFFALGTVSVYLMICPYFGLPAGDHPVEMMKLMLSLILCHFPVAAAVASVCRERYSAFQLLLGTTLFFFTLSGFVWPKFAMPEWLVPVTDFLAIDPTMQALSKITYKGAVLADCSVELAQLRHLFFLYLGCAFVIIHRDLLVLPFKKLFGKRHKKEALEREAPEVEGANS